MLDRWTTQWVRFPVNIIALFLDHKGIHPDRVTLIGFLIGMAAILLLAYQLYISALIAILLNRLMDGLDGALARLQRPSDAGGFLDITLDFIFYAGVVFGFALADSLQNGMAACFLVFSFMGTGASFLSYAAMAEKHRLTHPFFPHKSLYYLGGLADGTETIVFFVTFCLLPEYFAFLAVVFAIICLITTVTRVWVGYHTIRHSEALLQNSSVEG